MLLTVAFLAGCDNRTAESATTMPINDMDFALADSSDIEVSAFQLGDIELTAFGDRTISAPLDGIIAIPQTEGPHPVAVIFHGAQNVSSIRARVYTGFDYLVRQLAAEGFVAISVNMLANYSFMMGEQEVQNGWAIEIFNSHIASLEAANLGYDAGFDIDLTGMIDTEQIHLIGHSRGGEVAGCIVFHDQDVGRERIRSMVRIGTTIVFHDDYASHPDIPTGIIIAEFDGDVSNHDGQLVFDEVLMMGQNQSIVSLVHLRGANHNFFNRMVTVDDRVGIAEINAAHLAYETWLTREQQEDFLTHYVSAFLSMVTGSRVPWGVFDPSVTQPATMFGYAITASTYIPGRERVLPSPSDDAVLRYITATELAIATIHEQAIPRYSYAFFNHPTALARYDRRPFYTFVWDGHGGAVSIALLESNLTAYNALSLYVAVDSSNELNAESYQSFTVALTDEAGNEHRVIIPSGTSALSRHPGYAIEQEWINDSTRWFWVGFMPLGELRLPLDMFDGVDLSAVAYVSIIFDQTLSGAVMMSGIYVK